MIKVLSDGIATLANTVTGLSSSNFFFDRAEHNELDLFGRFFSVSNDFEIDSGTEFEEDNYQVDFVGTTLTEVYAIAKLFDTTFNLTSSLTVSGYSVILNKRVRIRGPHKDSRMWTLQYEYFVHIEKERS